MWLSGEESMDSRFMGWIRGFCEKIETINLLTLNLYGVQYKVMLNSVKAISGPYGSGPQELAIINLVRTVVSYIL